MTTSSSSKIQTVTELTRSLKGILETGFSFVAVCGEVSNLKQPYSGHLYFTLKDHDAQLRAVMFKLQRRYLASPFADGEQVICRGRLSVYEPRGEYQMIVDSVEAAGFGDKLAAFAKLKEKLYREGLFAEEHKRRLPLLPQGVALITSPQGAAIHDFLTVAARRFPSVPIEVFPVSVQGSGAAVEIAAAISAACQRRKADVIVVCRGGGSVEDLWPFNDEALARAVWRADLPVVSAIGHEIDVTILDYVADCRAPTPSAAAEMVLPEREQLRREVRQHTVRQQSVLNGKLIQLRHRLSLQTRLLSNPARIVASFQLRIDFLATRLLHSINGRIQAGGQKLGHLRTLVSRHNPQVLLARHQTALAGMRQRLVNQRQRLVERRRARLTQCTAVLRSVSPQAVLDRGYAIVQHIPGGEIVKSADGAHPDDQLSLRLSDGVLMCRVEGDALP